MTFQKALVTGGAGFIGSYLADALCGLCDVAIVDDLSAGRNLSNKNLWIADVTDSTKMRRIFDRFQPDIIFHLAASKKNVCLNNPRRDLEVNAGGTLGLLLFAKEYGVKRFIHVSTGSVYGRCDGLMDEQSAPIKPASYYGISKAAGERYALMFRDKGLNVTALRYFHVYGPRQDSSDDKGGVVAIFCRRLREGKKLHVNGTGLQERRFTYVKDVVNATIHLAQLEQTEPIYNIIEHQGPALTVLGLASMLGATMDDVVYTDELEGDIFHFNVSGLRLKETGFTQWTDLRKGIAETKTYYDSL